MKHRHRHLDASKKIHQKRWLWWFALLFASGGTAIYYMYYMDRFDPLSHEYMSKTLLYTVIAVGVCAICATSDWWMKR